MLTKSQEIQKLQGFIKRLHKQDSGSYLVSWLTHVLPQVEQSIQSDIVPWITPSEMQEQCEEMKREAESYCNRLLNQAKDHIAKQEIEHKNKLKILVSQLRRMEDEISSFSDSLQHKADTSL